LKEAIERIVEALRQPLSDRERDAGWSRAIKASYVPVFTKLLGQVESGKKPPYFGIVRSLDAYGIETGELYEMILLVAREANNRFR
jgi:hypothetical protein